MRRAAPVVLLLAAALVAVVMLGGGDERMHRFTVKVGEATNVVDGQYIRQSGSVVGRIASIRPVDRGANALLELEVEDRVWPLPAEARMALRWSGTANFGNRYIELTPGRAGGSAVAEGGTFPTSRFKLPVDFDELLAAFPDVMRKDLRGMLAEAGPALSASKGGLRETLRVAPPALTEAAYVVRDLNADHRALRTLVRSTDSVLGAVQSSQPGVRELLDGAAGTFDAIADETAALQQGLDQAPGTLRNARRTLAIADGTLKQARTVVADLGPGVAQLRRTARPLSGVLATVRRVGPNATATLSTARRAVPDVDPLLGLMAERSPQLGRIGKEAVKALECIRPFTPDILSFFSNWGDFLSVTDGKDKLIRAQVQSYGPAFSNASPFNAAQAAKLFSGLEYGFPRPPGTNAGQPWFLPECGAGPDALDPNKDPEIRESSKVFDMPSLRAIQPVPAEGRR